VTRHRTKYRKSAGTARAEAARCSQPRRNSPRALRRQASPARRSAAKGSRRRRLSVNPLPSAGPGKQHWRPV